jgi:hypothetical protein
VIGNRLIVTYSGEPGAGFCVCIIQGVRGGLMRFAGKKATRSSLPSISMPTSLFTHSVTTPLSSRVLPRPGFDERSPIPCAHVILTKSIFFSEGLTSRDRSPISTGSITWAPWLAYLMQPTATLPILPFQPSTGIINPMLRSKKRWTCCANASTNWRHVLSSTCTFASGRGEYPSLTL